MMGKVLLIPPENRSHTGPGLFFFSEFLGADMINNDAHVTSRSIPQKQSAETEDSFFGFSKLRKGSRLLLHTAAVSDK